MWKFFLALMSFLVAGSLGLAAQPYAISGRIPLAGDGGWDYLLADSVNRQLYVSHGTEVDVVDLPSEKLVGKIAGMKRIHGIVVANDLNRGFISDGGDNVVVVFDLKSRAILQRVPAGKNPDGVLYDPFSRRVFAFNGQSHDVTAIEAASGKVAGTIALDGKPEFPVTDEKGNVYVNIEDKSEISQLDPQTLAVRNTWPISPCEEPSGLAIDVSARRLFSVCSNNKMAVVNADSGHVVATVAIGNGPDAAAFDTERKLAFSSNGEGNLTVVRQDSPDNYTVLA